MYWYIQLENSPVIELCFTLCVKQVYLKPQIQ